MTSTRIMSSDEAIAEIPGLYIELLTDTKKSTKQNSQAWKYSNDITFRLGGINVAFANAIRRCILSDIPIPVFRVSPHANNKCTIFTNTTGLTNEIVKHRLSCVPIHTPDMVMQLVQKGDHITFAINDQFRRIMMVVKKQNDSEGIVEYVTTKDFQLQNMDTSELLPEKIRDAMFPADEHTGDHIDLVRLRPKLADEFQGRALHLQCEFDIGTAKEDGAYNVVSTCSYGNTIDETEQARRLELQKAIWTEEKRDIQFEIANWKLLEGKRIYKPNSFDFTIVSIGIYSVSELLALAIDIVVSRLATLTTYITVSANTIPNCFDVAMEEDHTVGKILEHIIYRDHFEGADSTHVNKVTYVTFDIIHPHDKMGILRLAFEHAKTTADVHAFVQTVAHKGKSTMKAIGKKFQTTFDVVDRPIPIPVANASAAYSDDDDA